MAKSWEKEIATVGALLIGGYVVSQFISGYKPGVAGTPGIDCIAEGETNFPGGLSCCEGLTPVRKHWYSLFPTCVKTTEAITPEPTTTVPEDIEPGCVAKVQNGNPSYNDLINWVDFNRPGVVELQQWRMYWLQQEPQCFGLINDVVATVQKKRDQKAIVQTAQTFTEPSGATTAPIIIMTPEGPAEAMVSAGVAEKLAQQTNDPVAKTTSRTKSTKQSVPLSTYVSTAPSVISTPAGPATPTVSAGVAAKLAAYKISMGWTPY